MRILFLGDVVGNSGCSKILNNLFSRNTILFISMTLVCLIAWYFYAYNLPTELSAHGDNIVFPDLYVPVLINRARYYMHQFKDNPQASAFALEDYKRGLKTMKYHLMEPTPNYVKDDRIRFV